MEGLANQAKPARIRASIEATIEGPTCARVHAFQAHSLQIILLGPFVYEPNVMHGLLHIVSLHLVIAISVNFYVMALEICIATNKIDGVCG